MALDFEPPQARTPATANSLDLASPPNPAATTTLAGPPPPPPLPPPPGKAQPRWGGLAQPAFVLGVGAALGAYVYTIDPNESSFLPTCPLYALTGLDCPTCGSTRAVHALLHGDPGRALSHNLLFVLLLPFLLYGFVRWSAARVGYTLPKLWRRWMRWPAVGIVAAFFIARNLPFEPFSYLSATVP